ncbi:glycosyltransferase [Luteococcus japonicus]|uniref:UDP-glucose:sterol glucosyltransferase n=1 Tax=Luteococcus japonicus LSP_Lj1 TaxID=1255658 RepID=A0A1R4KJU7_9ACTN|nr:glycosyltransferase [Luteococcus japonicus]SJN44621.1 UDP-glucose:sterol glucosyltransferase [Luteococcus japonicus LSP_Lj1]
MFVLLALGSRGDVQPLATLAGALTDAGHEAAVIALAEYAPLAQSLAPQADFVPVDASLDDALSRGPVQDLAARSLGGQYLLLKTWTSGMAGTFTDALLATVRPGDTIVTGVLARGAAMACVAGRGCGLATVVFTGQLPTLHRGSFMAPQYFTGWKPYDAWGTRFSWELSTSLGNALTNATRHRLGLPHKGFRDITRLADEHRIILAASPLLVPPADDWPATTRRTGYLAPPSPQWTPDTDLAAFLRRDPVFVGFGSFTQFTADADLEAIIRTARSTGRPLLTLAPPGTTPGHLDDDVLAIPGAPFSQLYPRVAATIHHGGAGTSHEALRSGRPTAVVPFGVDQPFHASRLHALGLGPTPGRLRRNHLDADDLARLVDALTVGPQANAQAERAREIGELARREDGLALTVEVMTSWIEPQASSSRRSATPG